MNNFIIGIAGQKGVGKDTLASMINYIIEIGPAKATYAKYLTWIVSYKHRTKRTIHFADNLKECVSIIYNIPRDYFDDRLYKDEYFYWLEGHIFLSPKDVKVGYTEITINELYEERLIDIMGQCDGKSIIKLRTLLQYFGTDMCREMLGQNIWINSCLNKATDIAKYHTCCCIADVRFSNEADAIQHSLLYGEVIMVNRKTDTSDNHISEKCDFECPITIDNNGSKSLLFYKALNIVQNLFRK